MTLPTGRGLYQDWRAESVLAQLCMGQAHIFTRWWDGAVRCIVCPQVIGVGSILSQLKGRGGLWDVETHQLGLSRNFLPGSE